MEKLKVKIKVLEKGTLPTKAHKTDACFDLYVRDISTYVTKTGEPRIVYHCGITTEIPEGYEAVIRPRSSIRKYNMVMPNSPGTIDSGFRGEWLVTMLPTVPLRKREINEINTNKKAPIGIYNIGDRVAQFCIKKVIEFEFKQENKKLAKSERASKGHGASGE